MMKRDNGMKQVVKIQSAQSGPGVRVEYPKEGELLTRPCYTFRIATISGANKVEVSIDQTGWQPCRESLGLWWYDWAGYSEGDHTLVARTRIGNDISASSLPCRFKVS
jgi:hypothetical protein